MRTATNVWCWLCGIAFIALLGACSNEDEPLKYPEGKKLEYEFLRDLKSGDKSYTLESGPLILQERVEGTENDWIDSESFWVGNPFLPFKMVIQDGKIYYKVLLRFSRYYSYMGAETQFKRLWDAYVKETGFDRELYVVSPLEVDFDRLSMRSFDRHELVINGMGPESVEFISLPVSDSGDSRFVIRCRLSTPEELPSSDKMLVFEEPIYAFRYVLECARKQWGDVIGRNVTSYSWRQNEKDIVLDDLERLIDRAAR